MPRFRQNFLMSPRLMLALLMGSNLPAVVAAESVGLIGKEEGDMYLSATGEYKIIAPVLRELGGTITDTENVVTFSDSYNTHISIACFPQDASQRWEYQTTTRREYLLYFFSQFVLADFQQRFPGAAIQSARFLPDLHDGALLTYALLPGGSFFEDKSKIMATPGGVPVQAKRGSLLFVRRGFIYILSVELAERATQRSTYQMTTEQEDTLLSVRLTELVKRLIFSNALPSKT